MKKLKTLGIFGMVGLATIAFCLSVLFARASDAVGAQYQRMIEQGIIDAVVTPHELGLDYLEHEPVELAASDDLLNAIYEAEEGMTIMPEDIALGFPGGSNSPIRIGQIPDDNTGMPGAAMNVIFEGFMLSGRLVNFTPGNLGSMFNAEYNNGGNLPRVAAQAQNILLADASGTFFQARRIPVIDLVVRDSMGRRALVRRVNANAVCRDGVNAFHNRTYRRM